MSNESIRRSAADLAWSLWTELGVPGVVRHHAAISVDVEPLLIVTPALAGDDSRLLEQVLGWCVTNGALVNTSRLTTLLACLPALPRAAFEQFAATANAAAGTKWPASGSSWEPMPRVRPVPMHLGRPSLWRLRARALCGVGTRADVLCDLAIRYPVWTSAAQLAEGGHSKRNVARVLADFVSAGIILQTEAGNKLRFCLARPLAFSQLLGDCAPASPDWPRIFALALRLLDFAAMPDATASVGRVHANNARGEVSPLSDVLHLDAPPETRGNPDALNAFREWAERQISDLANGTSPALGYEPTGHRAPTTTADGGKTPVRQ